MPTPIDSALVDAGFSESFEGRKRRLARERKQRQRAREEAMNIKVFPLPLAAVQRVDLQNAAAAARGFEEHVEYIIDLINRDLSQLGIKRCKPADLPR